MIAFKLDVLVIDPTHQGTFTQIPLDTLTPSAIKSTNPIDVRVIIRPTSANAKALPTDITLHQWQHTTDNPSFLINRIRERLMQIPQIRSVSLLINIEDDKHWRNQSSLLPLWADVTTEALFRQAMPLTSIAMWQQQTTNLHAPRFQRQFAPDYRSECLIQGQSMLPARLGALCSDLNWFKIASDSGTIDQTQLDEPEFVDNVHGIKACRDQLLQDILPLLNHVSFSCQRITLANWNGTLATLNLPEYGAAYVRVHNGDHQGLFYVNSLATIIEPLTQETGTLTAYDKLIATFPPEPTLQPSELDAIASCVPMSHPAWIFLFRDNENQLSLAIKASRSWDNSQRLRRWFADVDAPERHVTGTQTNFTPNEAAYTLIHIARFRHRTEQLRALTRVILTGLNQAIISMKDPHLLPPWVLQMVPSAAVTSVWLDACPDLVETSTSRIARQFAQTSTEPTPTPSVNSVNHQAAIQQSIDVLSQRGKALWNRSHETLETGLVIAAESIWQHNVIMPIQTSVPPSSPTRRRIQTLAFSDLYAYVFTTYLSHNPQLQSYVQDQLLGINECGDLEADVLCIPDIATDGILTDHHLQWRGNGNRLWAYYFNPFRATTIDRLHYKLPVPINVCSPQTSVQWPQTNRALKPFEPVANCSAFSILHDAITLPSVLLQTDIQSYHASIKAILNTHAPQCVSRLSCRAVENIIVQRDGQDKLTRFCQLFTHNATELNEQLIARYFSHFEQLDYFIVHHEATAQAIDELGALPVSQRALWFRFLSHIGLSRQPLDKLVADYKEFLTRLQVFDLSVEDILSKSWVIPSGGSDPAVMMDIMLSLLEHAQSNGCFKAQWSGLDGLELSALACVPLINQNATFVCADMLPKRPSGYTLKPELPRIAEHRQLTTTQWPTLLQQLKTQRDFFWFLAQVAPKDDSFATLKQHIKTTLDLNQPSSKQRLAFLILCSHKMETELTPNMAKALATLIETLDGLWNDNNGSGDLTTLAQLLLSDTRLRFADAEDVQECLQFITFLVHQNGVATPEQLRAWFDLWNRDPTTIKLFHAVCREENAPATITARIHALRVGLTTTIGQRLGAFLTTRLVCLCTTPTLLTANENQGFSELLTTLTNEPNLKRLVYILTEGKAFTLAQLLQVVQEQLPTKQLGISPVARHFNTAIKHSLITNDEGLQKILLILVDRYPDLRFDGELQHVLSIHCKTAELNPDPEFKALLSGFYRIHALQALEEPVRSLLSQVFHAYSLQTGNLCAPKTLEPITRLIQEALHFQSCYSHYHPFLLQQAQSNSPDQLLPLIELLLHYDHSDCRLMLNHIYGLDLSASQQQQRVKQCLQLSQAGYSISRLETIMQSLAQLPDAQQGKLVTVLLEQAKQLIPGSLIDILFAHKAIHLDDSRFIALIPLLINVPPHTVRTWIDNITAEELDALLNAFTPGDPSSLPRRSQALLWLINSSIHASAEARQTINSLCASFCQTVMAFTDVDLQHLNTLFTQTTPNVEYLLKVTGKTLTDLLANPRGVESWQRGDLPDKEQQLMHAMTIQGASLATLPAAWQHHTLSLTGLTIYQGQSLDAFPITSIPDYLKTLRAIPEEHVPIAQKAWLALPLVEKALFYAKGWSLNTAQRLAIVQAMTCEQPIVLQQIATGEGKTPTDMVKAAALWICCGGGIEYTTAALTDAANALEQYRGFFKVLGIPVANTVCTSTSCADDYLAEGLNVSTLEELALWTMKIKPPQRLIHAVVNEIDSAVFDRTQPIRIAHGDPLFKHNPWVYETVFRLYQSRYSKTAEDDLINTVANDLVRGDWQAALETDLRYHTSNRPLRYKRQQTLSKLTHEQWLDLIIAASVADKTKPAVDYNLLLDNTTGLYHIHPLINDRLTADQNTQFARAVHQFIASKINLARRSERDPYVQLGNKTIAVTESDLQGFLLSRLQGHPRSRLLGSSGTVYGSDQELAWYETYFGKAMAIVTLPENEPTQRLVYDPIECPNQDTQFAEIIKRITLIQNATPQRPTVVYVSDLTAAEQLQQILQRAFTATRINRYDGDTKKEAQFVDLAAKSRAISVATNALSRNIDYQQQTHGLAVICATKPRPRDERQIIGRAGRKGSHGEVHVILNQQQPRKPTLLHTSIGHRYLMILAQSAMYDTLKSALDTQLKQNLIDRVQEQARHLKPDGFLAWLTSEEMQLDASSGLSAAALTSYTTSRDTFIRQEACYDSAFKCSTPSPLPTTEPLPYQCLETLCNNPHLRSLITPPSQTTPDLLNQWLSSVDIRRAEANFRLSWVELGQEPASTLLAKSIETTLATLDCPALLATLLHYLKKGLFQSQHTRAMVTQAFELRVNQLFQEESVLWSTDFLAVLSQLKSVSALSAATTTCFSEQLFHCIEHGPITALAVFSPGGQAKALLEFFDASSLSHEGLQQRLHHELDGCTASSKEAEVLLHVFAGLDANRRFAIIDTVGKSFATMEWSALKTAFSSPLLKSWLFANREQPVFSPSEQTCIDSAIIFALYRFASHGESGSLFPSGFNEILNNCPKKIQEKVWSAFEDEILNANTTSISELVQLINAKDFNIWMPTDKLKQKLTHCSTESLRTLLSKPTIDASIIPQLNKMVTATFADDSPIVDKAQVCATVCNMLLRPTNNYFNQPYLETIQTLGLLKTDELNTIKTQCNRRIKRAFSQQEPVPTSVLKPLSLMQQIIFKDKPFVAIEPLIARLEEYKHSSIWPIQARRKTAVDEIIRHLREGKPEGYAQIVACCDRVVAEDLRSQSESWLRFIKPLHASGKSRFLDLMHDLLPLIKATWPVAADTNAPKPKPTVFNTQTLSFFAQGLRQVVETYNQLGQQEYP